MGASWRILDSVLTMPFPREASSRMWGYEVFFSSCTTRAGCTFIYPGDGLTTETLVLVLSGAVTAPEHSSRHSSPVPPAAGPELSFAWMWCLTSAPSGVLDWVWALAGISGYLKCRLELLWKFLSCSTEFLHFCAPSFWGILSSR